jgi:hypothetical protein
MEEYDSRKSCPKKNFLNWRASKYNIASIVEDVSTANQLMVKIEEGTSESLNTAIETGGDEAMLTAFSNASPHVSEPMLIYLVNHSGNYSDSAIYQILELNEPLSPATIDSIQNSSLPAWIKSQFSSPNGVNPFIELVENASYHMSNALFKVTETLQAMEQDTTLINPYLEIQSFIDSVDFMNMDALRLSFAVHYNDSNLIQDFMEEYKWGSELDEFVLLQNAKRLLEENGSSIYHVWSDTTGQFQTIIEGLDSLNSPYTETLMAKLNSMATEFKYFEEIPEFSFTRMMQITNVPEEQEVALLLFPNPVQDELNVSIELNDTEVAQCELYNVSGKLMHSGELRFRRTSINVNELESGIYLVKLIMPDGTMKLGKIIKQ